MKMKTIAASMLVTLSLASASAMAGTQVAEIHGAPFSSTATDFSSNVYFDGFNSSLGTLTGVSVEITALVNGTVEVTNYTASTQSGRVWLDVSLGFGGVGVAQPFYTQKLYDQTYSLGVNQGVTLGGSGSITGSTNLSSGFGSFTASQVNGTVAIAAKGNSVAGEDVDVWFQTSAIASGKVIYTYTAAPVPEPETYGMLLAGLGLLGVVARRKRAAAKA